MIGNDIVDLSITQVGKGTRRMRFIKKIFTDEEIDLIKNSIDEDLLIWLMWSIKESVYKIVARQEKRIRYAPKSICCQSIISLSNNLYKSIVMYDNQTFTSTSIIKRNCIHTVAYNGQGLNTEVKYASFEITNNEDTSLFLDKQIVAALKISQTNLKGEVILKRDEMRIPRVYKGDAEVALLSLSHHGKYGGYAYLRLSHL